MAREDNNLSPRGISIKPISPRQFLDDDIAATAEQRIKDLRTITDDEKRFREILESIEREGTERLIHNLRMIGFFTAPGSVVHHSNWKGGLVNHSLKVYDCAMKIREEMIQEDSSLQYELKEDSIAVAALLHDICKADEYQIMADGTPARKDTLAHIGGHGYKSVIMILFQGFKLTEDELLAIRWHMGSKRIKDPEEKAECEKAKNYALVRLLIQADHEAATSR